MNYSIKVAIFTFGPEKLDKAHKGVRGGTPNQFGCSSLFSAF